MPESVGIRMDEELLNNLNELSREENMDRSTLVRKLLRKGLKEWKKDQAAERYRRGEITLTKAAEEAEITIWEMEKFLVNSGYVSKYSVKDLKRELSKL